MSEFSGKCDCCDWFSGKDDEHIKNSNFYIHGPNLVQHKLEINNRKDLIKYYPYLISSGGYTKGGSTVHFSSESFVDLEEKNMMKCRMDHVKKYFRSCKRKKIPFDREEAYKLATLFNRDNIPAYIVELVDRVEKYGDKANIDDLHDDMHDYYRKKLFNHMIENGYEEREATEFVFGWKYEINKKGTQEEEKDSNSKSEAD